MKVICGDLDIIKMNDQNSFTANKEYIVLGIHIVFQQGIKVWLLNDTNKLVKKDILGFETSAQKFSERWTPKMDNLGGIIIMPARWTELSFLNALENGTAQNLDLFIEEATLTYEHEGMIFPTIKD